MNFEHQSFEDLAERLADDVLAHTGDENIDLPNCISLLRRPGLKGCRTGAICVSQPARNKQMVTTFHAKPSHFMVRAVVQPASTN
jgi:hypothetical protein